MTVLRTDCAAGDPTTDPIQGFGEVADWITCPWCHQAAMVPVPHDPVVGIAKGHVSLLIQECSACFNAVEIRLGGRQRVSATESHLRIESHRYGEDLRPALFFTVGKP